LTPLPLRCKALYAYLIDASLLVFSEKSDNVYGFEKEAAALFLEIEAAAGEKGLSSIKETFAQVPVEVVENFYRLASCRETSEPKNYSPPFTFAPFVPDWKERRYYVVKGMTFAIHFPKLSLCRRIHPSIAHLSAERETEHVINVDLLQREEYWEIRFNGSAVHAPLPHERLFPVLMEKMLIACSERIPFLISMHAAAVGWKEHVVVMPAVSGSGKSTLTAALMHAGFELYSDEMATLDREGKVRIHPFAVNVKEGSWNVLEPMFEGLGTGVPHRRFDGQKLRYLPPENLPSTAKKATRLIFPKYREGADTTLREVSACEAMMRIREGGYKLQDPLDREHFEKILETLLLLPRFSLEYSSLENAVETIREVCHGRG
jgi:hypothetical protein